MTLRLEQSWSPEGGEHGTLTFRLHNLGDADLAPRLFCYASLTRVAFDAEVRGGRLVRRFANHVEIAPDGNLPAGGVLELATADLVRKPSNRSQGAMAAWVELANGDVLKAEVGDLAAPSREAGPGKTWPEGRVAEPLNLLPWPVAARVTETGPAPLLTPADAATGRAMATVSALHRRLFPAAASVMGLDAVPGGTAVRARVDAALASGGYTLDFGAEIALAHSDAAGLRHGLVALAQMAHGARTDARFAFPSAGTIEDAPRFDWRGCHLDVARNFRTAPEVMRFLDILAWLKMNRMHWHLTDDEAWRLPSKAFPELASAGTRARGTALTPQYADGPNGQQGVYTFEDVARITARGQDLGVTVMPELDMPGHMTALLTAVEGLADPEEPAESYRSIQGYPNNAVNPALPRTYEVIGTILEEVAEMFPDAPLHVGADEVDEHAWQDSPAARKLANAARLNSASELQSHFLRKVQDKVRALGRDLAAWDEAAEGGGVDPAGTLLFAWRSKEKTAELIEAGYDVVATPGQAYYLDMVESDGWDQAGIDWAGVSTPEACYAYEPTEGLPAGPGRLAGVQACIWSEFLESVEKLNAKVFPRLAAIAETGWTPQGAKDWDRFCALSRLVPRL